MKLTDLRKTPVICCGAAALLIASTVWAQDSAKPAPAQAQAVGTQAPATAAAVERPKFMVLRFNEDWSVLGKGDPAQPDFFDSIKYIPLSDDGSIWTSFGGQIRERFEYWNHYNFGAPTTADDHDSWLLSRFMFHGDLHIGPYVRLFAEGKSALSWERDVFDGRRTLDDDHLDLQNLFLDVKLPLGENSTSLTLRGGRQELLFGAQRLVSPLDWTNTRRTFDGGSGILRLGEWNVSGFWTRPVIVEKYEFNEPTDEQEFFGVYASGPTPLKQSLGTNLDLYFLGLHRDSPLFNGLADVPVAFNGTAGDEERYTVGGRIFGKLPDCGFDYDLEGAYQFGEVGSGDVDAWMIASQFGYTLDYTSKPRLYIGFDYASGDDSPGGDVETFNQLFPLSHAYFGYIDAIGRQNIIDLSTGLSVNPVDKMTVSLDGHFFWRASDDDAVYNAGGGVLRAGNLSNASEVGSEIDLLVKYQFDRHLLGMLGYSHFFASTFIEESGASEDIDFVYAILQYTF